MIHVYTNAKTVVGTRESGLHKRVIDIFREDKPALCVCTDCGLTWEEGSATCAFECPGKLVVRHQDLRPYYIIRAGTTASPAWVYWTADGWERTDGNAVKFLTNGDALAVVSGILRPFDFGGIYVHEVQL